MIKIICVVGPTAVGKTKLSLKLAEKLDGEIISADSMQIYKEFNIISNKSDLKIKQYFVDFVSIEKEFSVAEYVKLGGECIREVNNKNKIPIICGGTGLYVDSLLNNINFLSFKLDMELGKKLFKLDNLELFEKLKKVDFEISQKININDKKRLSRALEFYISNNFPISEHIKNSKKNKPNYDITKIGLNYENRDALYEIINKRTDEMFKEGIVNEIKSLKNKKISKTAEAAIGYKEILSYINEEVDLETCKKKIKQNTRRYAKRQITWFKKDKNIKWFYLGKYSNFGELFIDVFDFINEKLR
ncbi:MAG: tRNA (adenosine(37)-N6)-dimethylallyltransferase [Candidatus Paraimprobicoccus trichonymphae]|uniref:tRNA dimethylallyltransferase n=1 Tax=Candidatus Paraimprobicoccus trichonymphae TaxID=3033793 RepID=A0AA48I5U3_9FIRM|nr:MAG: tRNA (adenosine(37)-N6)-dimethylallyltransferase [Candidatus Paraimprobicoccus trichonymphae]